MPPRIELCKVEDVPIGEVRKVEAGNRTVAVYNLDGAFFVTDNACTHGPGEMSEGFVDGDVIECNFHQGRFNIRSGDVVGPPCMVPLRTYRTIVDNGAVWIDVD